MALKHAVAPQKLKRNVEIYEKGICEKVKHPQGSETSGRTARAEPGARDQPKKNRLTK